MTRSKTASRPRETVFRSCDLMHLLNVRQQVSPEKQVSRTYVRTNENHNEANELLDGEVSLWLCCCRIFFVIAVSIRRIYWVRRTRIARQGVTHGAMPNLQTVRVCALRKLSLVAVVMQFLWAEGNWDSIEHYAWLVHFQFPTSTNSLSRISIHNVARLSNYKVPRVLQLTKILLILATWYFLVNYLFVLTRCLK